MKPIESQAARGAARPFLGGTHTVRMEAWGHRGVALGRLQGKVLFVPRSAPGDLLRVSVTRERADYMIGAIQEILEPSPLRTSAPCPHFPVCGGCQLQHLPYETQLQVKEEVLRSFLARLPGGPPGRVEGIRPSPHPFGYRCRIDLAIGPTDAGYHREGGAQIIAIQDCPIADPIIREVLRALPRGLVRRLWQTGIRGLELRANATTSQVLAILHAEGRQEPPSPAGARRLLMGVRRLHPALVGAAWGRQRAGTVRLPLVLGEIPYQLSPHSFVQVNLRQNESLVKEVLQLLGPAEGVRVLDLYCGVGNLSLPLARGGAWVMGIDGNPWAIADARLAARGLGLERARFRRGEVGPLVSQAAAAGQQFEWLIANPPRTGLKEVIPHLPLLSPRQILYISCEPSTLARDLALLAAHGYRAEVIVPFDMFPQTYHIETLALLRPVPPASDAEGAS